MDHPLAGTHYPRAVGEVHAWFRADADCLDYLEWLRWPAGFICPAGGHEAGLAGGRARGKKVLTGIAVEILEPKGFGRCRIRPLGDATAATLHRVVTDFVEPGATVITDGWKRYGGLDQLGCAACWMAARYPDACR